MKKKIIQFGNPAREGIRAGVKIITDAVQVTLGAAGRHVIIGREGGWHPHTTKDGVTVALQVEAEDPFEKIGVAMIKEVAQKTVRDAGDGTTTATILAREIIEGSIECIKSGKNPVMLKKEIEAAVLDVVEFIKKSAKAVDIEDPLLDSVATVSANNDAEIGGLIASTIRKIGKDGVINVETGAGAKTEVTLTGGMEIPQGFVSPFFINDPLGIKCEFKNPLVLVTSHTVSEFKQIKPILEKILKWQNEKQVQRDFLIVAKDMEGEALATLVTNKMRNNMRVGGMTAPFFGDMRLASLEDIAIFSGARLISEENGDLLENTTLENLGFVESANIFKDKTVLVASGETKLAIVNRSAQIKEMIESAASDGEKDNFKLRLARINGSVAVLKVGGFSNMEIAEKKDRIDDSLRATMCALDEGVVPGGASIYLQAAEHLKPGKEISENPNWTDGAKILAAALRMPFLIMTGNAGYYPEESGELGNEILKKKNKGCGFNVLTSTIEDMFKSGIVDPAKVARVVVENAASVACVFLTTECVIAVKEDDNAKSN